ncbi:MAG: hypothetical protein GY765_21210 [bacterium]|nr:hypothetical protein [bacterium]
MIRKLKGSELANTNAGHQDGEGDLTKVGVCGSYACGNCGGYMKVTIKDGKSTSVWIENKKAHKDSYWSWYGSTIL